MALFIILNDGLTHDRDLIRKSDYINTFVIIRD